MNWQTEWKAISARIHGLAESVKIYQGLEQKDSYGIGKNQLAPSGRGIYETIEIFIGKYKSVLPENMTTCFENFSKHYRSHFNVDTNNNAMANTLTILLVSLQSELDYYLSDLSVIARRLSERAFIHLQRCIVADPDFKSRWKKAFFEEGETACEKLGAVHLLLHGIWPFKVSVTGEETDLVFQDAPIASSEAERAAEAMVLTEWKIVRDQKDTENIAKAAKKQAERYKSGALGGLELTQYRYLVLVSEKNLPPIPDIREGQTLYRHINIAVDPSMPSRERASRLSWQKNGNENER